MQDHGGGPFSGWYPPASIFSTDKLQLPVLATPPVCNISSIHVVITPDLSFESLSDFKLAHNRALALSEACWAYLGLLPGKRTDSFPQNSKLCI